MNKTWTKSLSISHTAENKSKHETQNVNAPPDAVRRQLPRKRHPQIKNHFALSLVQIMMKRSSFLDSAAVVVGGGFDDSVTGMDLMRGYEAWIEGRYGDDSIWPDEIALLFYLGLRLHIPTPRRYA